MLEAFQSARVGIPKAWTKLVTVGFGVLHEGHDPVLNLLHGRPPILRRGSASTSHRPGEIRGMVALGCRIPMRQLGMRMAVLPLAYQQRGRLGRVAIGSDDMRRLQGGVACASTLGLPTTPTDLGGATTVEIHVAVFGKFLVGVITVHDMTGHELVKQP